MQGKARPAKVILEPNLSRCIETTAWEEFRRGVQALAAGKGNEALAERSEVLRLFLEGADFDDTGQRFFRGNPDSRAVGLLLGMI